MSMEDLLRSMKAEAQEENAFYMEKYMRYQFSFLGIKTPERRALFRGFLKSYQGDPLKDAEILYAYPHRECKYMAIDLLVKYEKTLTPEDLERILSLALKEPWWDTIDALASKVLGPMAQRSSFVKEHLVELISQEDIWLKRIAILFQLSYKKDTDEALLAFVLSKGLHTGEFFVDKALGWALREYSKTNKVFVQEVLHTYDVSSLTRREASKYL